MPKYSRTSSRRLYTCDDQIILVFEDVLTRFDHTILCGHRGPAEQNRLYGLNLTEVRWPESNHNFTPSRAVDAGPWPLVWPDLKNRPGSYVKDIGQFILFAGYVLATADQMRVQLGWGGDWDRDWDMRDQRFDDLVHFYLLRKE